MEKHTNGFHLVLHERAKHKCIVLGRMVSTDYLVIECVGKGQITLGKGQITLGRCPMHLCCCGYTIWVYQ
jgi:hypothetical protein